MRLSHFRIQLVYRYIRYCPYHVQYGKQDDKDKKKGCSVCCTYNIIDWEFLTFRPHHTVIHPFSVIYILPVLATFAEFPGTSVVEYRKEKIIHTAMYLIYNHIIAIV